MVTPVDTRKLRPGMILDRGLYTRHGVKLLSKGATLTESLCESLGGVAGRTVYLAESAEELAGRLGMEKTPVGKVGERSRGSLLTTGGVVALQKGEEIERHHLEVFEDGAFSVKRDAEIRKAWANRARFADSYVEERAESWEGLPLRLERGSGELNLDPTGRTGWPDSAGLARYRSERVELFRRMFARILAGVPVECAGLVSLVDELIDTLEEFPERFTQLALLAPREGDYLPDHCYTTAVLSVAIGAHLGLSRGDVRLVGLAGLVADVGMGLVPRDVRCGMKPLSEVEVNRVRRHPAFSVVLLDEVEGLPEPVRMAAAQHHERDNGAGYPQGLRKSRICDLARIVAVADAFAAATEPRPYRFPKKPYDAIEELIMLGSQGMYDRAAVRALVQSTGLFPVGSFVQLSTEERAMVIGSHRKHVDRPIVAVMKRPGDEPEVRDLNRFKPWELSVIQAIDPPAEWPPSLRLAG